MEFKQKLKKFVIVNDIKNVQLLLKDKKNIGFIDTPPKSNDMLKILIDHGGSGDIVDFLLKLDVNENLYYSKKLIGKNFTFDKLHNTLLILSNKYKKHKFYYFQFERSAEDVKSICDESDDDSMVYYYEDLATEYSQKMDKYKSKMKKIIYFIRKNYDDQFCFNY